MPPAVLAAAPPLRLVPRSVPAPPPAQTPTSVQPRCPITPRPADPRAGYTPTEKEVITSRLFAWALSANECFQETRRQLVLVDGRPAGLARNPGFDPIEALDAAHECEHGSLPHDSFVGCACWQHHGRPSDLNTRERTSRRIAARAA